MQPYSVPLEVGRQLVTDVGDPAAGGVFTYIPSDDQVQQLYAIFITLSTDANVANRRVFLDIRDTSATIFKLPADFSVTASKVANLSWVVNAPTVVDVQEDPIWTTIQFLPPRLILPRGGQLRLIITNIAATDQLTNIKVITKVWARP